MKISGPLFIEGQRVVLMVNCYICKAPIVTFHDRAVGVCRQCLKKENMQVGRALIVKAPKPVSRWN